MGCRKTVAKPFTEPVMTKLADAHNVSMGLVQARIPTYVIV